MRERREQMQADAQWKSLVERLIERMHQEETDFVDQPHDPSRQSNTPGQTGRGPNAAPFLRSTTRAWTFSVQDSARPVRLASAAPASDATTRAILDHRNIESHERFLALRVRPTR